MATNFEIIPLNDDPDSLQNLCLATIVQNLNVIAKLDANGHVCKLRDNIVLSAEVSEKLLQAYQKRYCVTDNIAKLFSDCTRTPLQNIRIPNSHITRVGLRVFMEHKPFTLELSQNHKLSQASISIINSNSANLISLKCGPLLDACSQARTNILYPRQHIIKAMNLRSLSMHCTSKVSYPFMFLSSFQINILTYLDISDCQNLISTPLPNLKSIRSLILHNIFCNKEIINWISTMHTLYHLDISQSNELYGKYVDSNMILGKIVTSLPFLEALDISNTNLAGSDSSMSVLDNIPSGSAEVHVRCDIPGLVCRINRPLKFLGLYGTHDAACRRHVIPAIKITGNANEDQILDAGVAYMERPVILAHVLRELYYMLRNSDGLSSYPRRNLMLILNAMERHVSRKNIQVAGSATLFYLLKNEKLCFGVMLKRRIITTLLDGMDAHKADELMIKNGSLILSLFKISRDVVHEEYERAAVILLNGIHNVIQERYMKRIALNVLNSLTANMNSSQKEFVGNQGAFAIMINLITSHLADYILTEALELAWSIMWNLTDQTPQNCELFMNKHGLQLFLPCREIIGCTDQLLCNMLGLLNNVAEVAELRQRLMDPLILDAFYDLLVCPTNEFEVSYSVVGVLVHIVSDGPQAWTVEDPARNEILFRMTSAMNNWNLSATRNIKYASFQSMLALLEVYHTPQCQHWAVWALANLTTVYPEKYCSLVQMEGGLSLLEELTRQPSSYLKIKELARRVITNCDTYTSARSRENNLWSTSRR